MSSEIEVSCPGCNAVFSVPVELAGEAAECSECAAVFEIPKLDERPDAIDTDTGVIKGIAPSTGDYTSTATNTVKLSRSSIGMIPTLKDSFTFGNKAPGAALGAPPPPPPPPAAPQPSAWGAQPGMQPRMAPPPQAPRPPMAPAPQAPVQQQQPRMAPPPAPQAAAPQQPPPRPAAPAPVPQQPQPAAQHQGGVASMLGGAPQAPAQKATITTRPSAPPQPPPARPASPPAPAAPSHQAPAAAPATSTQGVPATHASVKLPAWTKVQLKQGEEAIAYKEDNKNPAVPAVLASIPVVLSAGAVLLGTMGLIVVGVLCVITFIVAFIMSKAAEKRAVILTTQRAICILGKDRIELKK